jgi:transcriptional regulator with XRE-family HTH domain
MVNLFLECVNKKFLQRRLRVTGVTKIKIARLERGLRQWDVARQVGISESYLSKIETGRVKPDPNLLEKIAIALDVPVRQISEDEKHRTGRSKTSRVD